MIPGSDVGLGCFILALRDERGAGKCGALSGLPSCSEASEAAASGGRAGVHGHVSLRWLSEVFRPSTVAACAVRTWKCGALFPHGLVPGSPVSGVWVLVM